MRLSRFLNLKIVARELMMSIIYVKSQESKSDLNSILYVMKRIHSSDVSLMKEILEIARVKRS